MGVYRVREYTEETLVRQEVELQNEIVFSEIQSKNGEWEEGVMAFGNGGDRVAGGVPAMCDGVTQGQVGMELSLFSRDTIAQSTAIALSHQMFDGVVALGICDKIVPGILMGVLRFGYLPTIFVPAGPMRSGLENKEKQRIRQLYAEDKVTREELLNAEAKSYHSAGTCTFYGTCLLYTSPSPRDS